MSSGNTSLTSITAAWLDDTISVEKSAIVQGWMMQSHDLLPLAGDTVSLAI